MLCHFMGEWLLGWELWPGGKVLTLSLQELWFLLPLSQGIIFVLPFFPRLGLSLLLLEFCPGQGGWFAGGQEQPEQCLWGGSVVPQRHLLLLLHISDVTPSPKCVTGLCVRGAGWAKRF